MSGAGLAACFFLFPLIKKNLFDSQPLSGKAQKEDRQAWENCHWRDKELDKDKLFAKNDYASCLYPSSLWRCSFHCLIEPFTYTYAATKYFRAYFSKDFFDGVFYFKTYLFSIISCHFLFHSFVDFLNGRDSWKI